MNQTSFQTIIRDGHDAEQRLRELGLDLAGLQEIVRRGEYARAEATKNDPSNAAGSDAYRHRVRATRDTYGPSGWTIDRTGGLEMTRSPCGQRVVITRAGVNGVGLRGTRPQPKSTVGESTVQAIRPNGTLLLNADWLNVAPTTPAPSETWMLLVERLGDMVHSELSRPSAIENGEVPWWFERLLLPVIDLMKPENRIPSTPTAPDVIDVPVTRRSNRT